MRSVQLCAGCSSIFFIHFLENIRENCVCASEPSVKTWWSYMCTILWRCVRDMKWRGNSLVSRGGLPAAFRFLRLVWFHHLGPWRHSHSSEKLWGSAGRKSSKSVEWGTLVNNSLNRYRSKAKSRVKYFIIFLLMLTAVPLQPTHRSTWRRKLGGGGGTEARRGAKGLSWVDEVSAV